MLKSIQLAHSEKSKIKEIQSCIIVNSEKEVIKIEIKLKLSDSVLEVSFLSPVTMKENLKLQIKLK